MPVFEIKSFKGGISDWEDKGIVGAFKFGKNLSIRKKVDSLSCNQALEEEGLDSSQSPSLSTSPSLSGSLTPSTSASASSSSTPTTSASASPSPSASATPSTTVSSSISPSPSPSGGLTTIFDDLIIAFIKGSDGYTYGVGNAGSIYRRDASAYWEKVYTDPDGAIKGAEEMPSDDGTIYLGWCTNTKVKRKPLPGNAIWNDVEVVADNLSPQDWHTMKQVGGATHIANGSFIGLVGYDKSYTNEALDLIPGNLAKTLVERDGRTIIGSVLASNPTRSVNASIDTEVPLSQIGEDGEIIFADMSSSVPSKRFPGGGKVNPYGVCNEVDLVNFFEWNGSALSWIDKQSVGNLALFAVYGADTGYGGIYSYGRRNKNKDFVLNCEYQIDMDELGAICTVNGVILVSYQDGSDYGVKAVNPDLKATATYEGIDLHAPVKKPAEVTSWKYAEVYFKSFPKWASATFWYRIDKDGDWVQAKKENGSGSFEGEGENKAVFLIGEQGEIFEPRVILTPYVNTSPEAYLIRIYFD